MDELTLLFLSFWNIKPSQIEPLYSTRDDFSFKRVLYLDSSKEYNRHLPYDKIIIKTLHYDNLILDYFETYKEVTGYVGKEDNV